ncbi:MAG: L-aspartate oxidase [Flavobacteriales bacterium]|nr:L-aspartate oxidase [Flavobacteriales bacterium]MCB9449428.1 L-aspartate oxidase [Flavobacteriales bacterium]
MKKETDFLVIGSGIAGLSFALKAAAHGTVCMVTKAEPEESNTKYAQGGIAAVIYAPDTYEKHIADTLECGAGLCNEEVVRMVVSEAPERIRELVSWGVNFDKTPTGEFDLAMEGAHSEKRVLHHKDATGYEIETSLLRQAQAHKNITILDHHFVVDIITQHHLGKEVTRRNKDTRCFGAYVLDVESGKVDTFLSKITLMASGGAGHVYNTTTNPTVATGDGIAMVYRAKGQIDNMEFMQFHPTSLFNPGDHPSFLISEAVRGMGGILKNCSGDAFMKKYDERGSLAPRDIVARAIDNEMKTSGDDFVWLDCTRIDPVTFRDHFPTIYDKCMSIGIQPEKDLIPVVPAAHYLCGGIRVDMNARSSIQNLYAVGECSSTGLHGANRLASNSLLEAVVYAHRAYEDSIRMLTEVTFERTIPEWDTSGTEAAEEMILITQSHRELRSIMSSYVGIVRSDLRLQRALDRLEILYRETEALYEKTTVSRDLCELRNLINIAYLIIKMAMNRRHSIGLHYTLDDPDAVNPLQRNFSTQLTP